MGNVTISVSMLLMLASAAVIAVVLATVLVGVRRIRAESGVSGPFVRRNTILLCAGLLALAALVALLFLDSPSAEPKPESQTATQTPAITPTATPQPTQVVLTTSSGVTQAMLDELMKHCNDIMYYSNLYCGTNYIVEPEPFYSLDTAEIVLMSFYNNHTDLPINLIDLTMQFEATYASLIFYEIGSEQLSALTNSIQTSLDMFESCFQTKLLELPAQVKNDKDDGGGNVVKRTDDAAQTVQGDYLNGRRYTAEGTYSGDMYTIGQAFYFENGSVYATQEGAPADSAKADSGLYSPYDMSYTLNGNTITISGGGTTQQWTYDAARDVILAGGTELHRSY